MGLEDSSWNPDERNQAPESPYRIGNRQCARPFLANSVTLEKNWAHLDYLLISDPEAAMASCMSTYTEDEIENLPQLAVKQTKKSNDRYRIEYLASISTPKVGRCPDPTDTEPPSVGIVIINYNMGAFIERALSSLASQHMYPRQILLVNDGSTDSSSQIMRNWVEKLPNTRLFETENQGKARGLNTVLPYAHTDFVLELDADDWLDPDAIQRIVNMTQGLSPSVTLLYGNFRTWNLERSGTYRCAGVHVGYQIGSAQELLSYPLPLGPRIYNTVALKRIGGFPVSSFADGRLYEDVLVTRELLRIGLIQYQNFTVYNTLRHPNSITRQNQSNWTHFLRHHQDDLPAE